MGQSQLKSFALFAAVISLVQGVVWFILSLLAILSYNCEIQIDAVVPYKLRDYAVAYFQGSGCQYKYNYIRDQMENCMDNLTEADALVGLSSVVFAVNTLLIISSISLISATVMSKRQFFLCSLFIFLFFNFFVIILDLATTSVISSDFADFTGFECKNVKIDSKVGSLTFLILDIISSKGVILWLMNICLTIYLFVAASKVAGCGCAWVIDYKENIDESKFNKMNIKDVNNKEDLNKPIEVIYRNGSPEHSAMARWPALAINSPLPQVKDPRYRGPPIRRDSPPPASAKQPAISAPVTRNVSGSSGDFIETRIPRPSETRQQPMSLEEAIKTMKPLRHVNSPYR